MKEIKFSISNISNQDNKVIQKILKSGWLTHGKYTRLFEKEFCKFTKAKYAVSVSSCTAGLHLSCIAAGFKKGDEVIVPAQTHTATAHAVEYTGAKVIFVDVESLTGNIDTEKILKKITKKTKGIIIVHMAGYPCNVQRILKICKKKNLKLIEDCAHGLGTYVKKKHVGNYGKSGSFSFYPTKQITTGEGGAVITNDKNFYYKIKKLKAFGIDKDIKDRKKQGDYDVKSLGFNYRMTDFQAALGFNQVKNNTINFLNLRNKKNKNLKFGFNFIIIPENLNQLLEIPNLISSINNKVNNGNGVNFLTLRDDYQSVTSHSEKKDVERKYRLEKSMNIDEREKLKEIIFKFEEKRKNLCPDLYVDYGYSLESLFKGHVDTGLIKIGGNSMRKFGFTQMSVAIDLYGDVFLFREAGFLNRQGNKKMIIGRINKNLSLEKIIKNYLNKKIPLELESDDSRFMDSFDHVITSLVNQAEEDKKFNIPFNLGPISSRKENLKIHLGNNWYSETN